MCHLKALEKKGMITRERNMSRAIRLTREPVEERGMPLYGQIAAGTLHEAVEQDERIDFDSIFNRKNLFALRVSGDSMIEDSIADGDHVIVKKQRTARKGQIVVAITDEGEATLKRWYPEANRIRLEPANSDMKPIYVKDARLLGVVVGVVRRIE
jgi:repressor LexA